MTTSPPSWPQRHADIRRLFRLTGDALTVMQFDGSDLDDPLMYTAAYFARCRRLAMSMEALLSDGMSDMAGVALRPLLECWLRGRWLLHNGLEAYAKLRAVTDASHEQWKDRQSNRNWVTKMRPVWTRELGALKLVEEMGSIVGGHQISGGPALLEAYYMMYGVSSERDIHYGQYGVEGYMADGTGPLRIAPQRAEAWDVRKDITWAAHLVMNFAWAI